MKHYYKGVVEQHIGDGAHYAGLGDSGGGRDSIKSGWVSQNAVAPLPPPQNWSVGLYLDYRGCKTEVSGFFQK